MIISSICYFFWFAAEFLLSRFMRSKVEDQPKKDKGTLRLIWLTIMVTIFVSVSLSKSTNCKIGSSPITEYFGLAMLVIGVIFRMWVVFSLGRFFTVDVTIRNDHQLKKDGFYKWLRHPSYTFFFVSLAGLGISLNNWYSLLLSVSVMLLVMNRRIKVEEAALTEAFGNEYENYMKKTWRLIPFIY
jgi:protein-S-isoprenylcysteine O-methyltransferase Ste14